MLQYQTLIQRRGVVNTAMMPLAAAAEQKADAWADGKNAAPAIMCEVEKVPLLDSIPDG